jgi:hypothetical protein
VEIELYDRMLRETDFARQRELMRQFEKLVLDSREPRPGTLAARIGHIRTTISSRCQRLLGRERHRSRRAITGPNFSTQLRIVS